MNEWCLATRVSGSDCLNEDLTPACANSLQMGRFVMAKILKQLLRLATLLIGMSAASLALALATVDVTITGPKANETTIRISDSYGPVKADPNISNRYIDVDPGKIVVDVFDASGKQVGFPQTVTVENGPNQLQVDSVTGKVDVIPPPEKSASAPAASPTFPNWLSGVTLGGIDILGGGGGVNGLQTSIGVKQADDSALLNGKSRVNTTSYGFELPWVKDGKFFDRLTLAYTFGSGSTSTQTPADAKAGWTYFFLSPTLSTGLAVPGGINATLQTKIQMFNLYKTLPGQLLKEEKPWSIWGEPLLGYQYSKITYNGMLNSIVLPTISSTTNQQIKQNDFALGYGVLGEYKPAPDGGWVSGGAGLYADYYWARYNGSQWNMCPVCSMPTQMLSFSDSDRKNQLTFGAVANVAAGYPLGKNAGVYLFGQYRYVQDAATLENKTAPSSNANHLTNGSRSAATGGLGVQLSF
jgi:hypothetical protein